MQQVCKCCGIEKDITEFYKKSRNKSGFMYSCKECTKAYGKVYYKKNKETILKKAAKYQKDNLHIFREANKKWRSKNKAKLAKLVKKWCDDNKEKRRFSYSKRRALKLKATPSWADLKKIREVYAGAKKLEDVTGIEYHVDHIIPLQGKDVCGLHIWENLQVLEASINIKKGNRI